MATPTPPAGVVQYAAKLTGAPDALPDLELPISAFNASIRNGVPSYLSITVPRISDAADINARPNGDIVVSHYQRDSTGSVIATAIATVNFGTVRIDQGARSKSLTLSGNKQTTYNTPKTVTITKLSYVGTTNGARRWRTIVTPTLLPGDTIAYLAESFVVDYFTVSVSGSGREQMEIVESS